MRTAFKSTLLLLLCSIGSCERFASVSAQDDEQIVFELCDTIENNEYVDPSRMHAIWRPDAQRGWGSQLDYYLVDKFTNHLAYVTALRLQIELDDSAQHIDQIYDICGPTQAGLKQCADAVAGTSRSLRGSVKLDFPFERHSHAGRIAVIEKEQNLNIYQLCARTTPNSEQNAEL